MSPKPGNHYEEMIGMLQEMISLVEGKMSPKQNVCPLSSYQILLTGALMSTRDKTKESHEKQKREKDGTQNRD